LAGTLAIANGGTGQTTAAAGFNALSPVTTTGDLIVGNGTNSSTRLGIGSTSQVLTVVGGTAAWATPASGGVSTITFGSTGLTPATATSGAVTVAGTLAVANGGTGLTTTPANGALDIGNGTGFTRTTLTAGTNIAVTNGSGSISIATSATPSFATSVTTPLVIGGTTASSSLTLQSTSGVGTTDSILFKVGNNGATTAMTVDTSGNLLVGTTTLTDGSRVVIRPATNQSGLTIQQNGAGDYCMHINAVSNGGAFYYQYFSAGGTNVGSISSNTTTTTYSTSSDYRLKENVTPITTGLTTIVALKPVYYDWKLDGSKGEGFIAHELQEVIPHAVTGERDAVNEDGSIKSQGVDYSKVVVHLVAAIQELSAKNDALEARLAKLETVQ
jgi:hypothetical protein